MLKLAKEKLSSFLLKGHERTRLVTRNIIISFFFKGGNIVIGLILIPLTINYVNTLQYGIWITLSSIINWFSFFDIGLGNGLRNKIAESTALNEPHRARIYISTTYAVLACISAVLFLLFFIANRFINWHLILNVPSPQLNNLNSIALVIFGCFCIQFVFQLINIVLTALHAPSKVSFINFIGQLISLVTIYILTLKTKGTLDYLILALAGIPLTVQLAASIFYYNGEYKRFIPSIKLVKFEFSKALLNTGSAFFIIQIGALVLFETDNIVIIQIFGPKEVTVFNIAYKLFSVIIMISTIVMTPFWSAFTDAYTKGDYQWINETIKKMYKYLFGVCIVSLALFAASPIIFNLWLGGKVKVPIWLSFVMALQVTGYCWLMINCYLLNGIGKIKLQLYLYIFCMIVNIPLSIFLSRVIGIVGVTISNLVIFVYMDIILYIQSKKVLNQTATGIWNR